MTNKMGHKLTLGELEDILLSARHDRLAELRSLCSTKVELVRLLNEPTEHLDTESEHFEDGNATYFLI